MNFTFGIITDGNYDNRIKFIINSIEKQNIPNYEIVIVGNSKINNFKNVFIIPFYEGAKPKWITKKKNLITQNAKYENIVYMHDYIGLKSDWYNGFLKYGNDFDVCMTKILSLDGSRYRDWMIDMSAPILHILGPERRLERALPYNITKFSKIMYISGAYWIAKKHIMEKFPLDESLCWGQSEDIEWSHRVRKKLDFSINLNSTAMLLKEKGNYSYENEILMKSDILEKLNDLSEEEYYKILSDSDDIYFKYFGKRCY